MKKRILLYGPIGCGKSTIIRNALGKEAEHAGGYITLRVFENDLMTGFDLAPAAALTNPEALKEAERFLNFTGKPRRDPSVFSGLGRRLLREALEKPFAVADEFGGVELLIPEFMESLRNLLSSDVPCIGVFKTQTASEELIRRLHLGEDYISAYRSLYETLSVDPDTEILSTFGQNDDAVISCVGQWIQQYVRK